MINATRFLPALMTAVLIAGCASAGASTDRGSQNQLTREQIMSVNVPTLYDVIDRLRPRWLQGTGGEPSSVFGGENSIVVYQGQTLLGGPDILRQFSPDVAAGLRYLDGPTASATLPGIGTRHISGAIVLTIARN